MSATNILQKIQDTLIKKYSGDIEIKQKELAEDLFGPAFSSSYSSTGSEDDGDEISADAADSTYTTNVAIGPPSTKRSINKMNCPMSEAKKEDKKKDEDDSTDEDDVSADAEADMAAQAGEEEIEDATGDDMEASPEDVADDAAAEIGGDDQVAADADAAGDDMGGGDMGDTGGDMGDAAAGDPSMGGDMGGDMGGMGDIGGQEEEEKTAGEIGRIYELKKIYSRLTSIESYLGNESDQELLEIRNYVSKGIELFEIISANFNSYKDKLDEIIVTYYKFLMEVYDTVKKYYSKQKNSGD